MIQNMDGAKLYRIDLLNDTILAESEAEPQYWLMGRRENEKVVAYSFAHEAFVTLDENLKALQEIPIASSQFSYSQKEISSENFFIGCRCAIMRIRQDKF